MENKKRTAKRWRENEQRMLQTITKKFGAAGVVPVDDVPIDMWPPNRTMGASCFQLTQIGWKTTGLTTHYGKNAPRQFPAELMETNRGIEDKRQKRKRAPRRTTKTTTTWFWGLYTKTIEQ